MSMLKHLLDAPPPPAIPKIPDIARVERAVCGDEWAWIMEKEVPICNEQEWETILGELGKRNDGCAYRVYRYSPEGSLRRSAYFPVWSSPPAFR